MELSAKTRFLGKRFSVILKLLTFYLAFSANNIRENSEEEDEELVPVIVLQITDLFIFYSTNTIYIICYRNLLLVNILFPRKLVDLKN
jgi:hypothetical protein